MKLTQADPHAHSTMTFDWGSAKWLISPSATPGAGMSFGQVVLNPGHGHDRHNHPGVEEVLYVLSGAGSQMLDDHEPFPVHAGEVIYVPRGVFHSTHNTGWEPLRLIAVYNPGGEEQALTGLPDFKNLAPGEVPNLVRGE